MVQFNELIYQLSRKFNWEIQIAAIPAGNKLDSKYNPLARDVDRERRSRRSGEEGAKQENHMSFETFESSIRSFVN